MEKNQSKKCMHCGAASADLYANDGARVCDRCFAYDQMIVGELRASQSDLGLVPTGEMDGLVDRSRRRGTMAAIACAVFSIATLLMFSVGPEYELGFVGGALVAVLAVLSGWHATRMLRFAKTGAPEVIRRASSYPPAALPRAAAR